MTRSEMGIVVLAAARGRWYDRVLDSLPRTAEIFTALLGAIALAGIVRGIYRRTLGRRRDRYARLRRLGTNAQLSFFSSVLGEPPAIERTFFSIPRRYDDSGQLLPEVDRLNEARTFKESVWIDRDFYVHALADQDETVHAYSVTTRSKRFRPTFQIPGGTAEDRTWLDRLRGREFHFKPNAAVTLGKTRFAALGRPGQAAAWIGAHNWHYFEPYYFGNPGYYQNFVFSINDAGTGIAPFSPDWLGDFSWGFGDEPPGESVEEVEAEEELDFEVEEDPPLPPDLVSFRRSAEINTYTVVGPDLPLDDYPLAEGDRLDQYPVIFGVSSYRVRTLGGA